MKLSACYWAASSGQRLKPFCHWRIAPPTARVFVSLQPSYCEASSPPRKVCARCSASTTPIAGTTPDLPLKIWTTFAIQSGCISLLAAAQSIPVWICVATALETQAWRRFCLGAQGETFPKPLGTGGFVDRTSGHRFYLTRDYNLYHNTELLVIQHPRVLREGVVWLVRKLQQ